MSGSTEHRKADHIEIVLEKDVAAKGVTLCPISTWKTLISA
jgi:hypothetical protein